MFLSIHKLKQQVQRKGKKPMNELHITFILEDIFYTKTLCHNFFFFFFQFEGFK